VAVPGSAWTIAEGKHVSVNRFGILNIVGDRSIFGYQLTSPRIAAPAGASVLVHARLTTWHGELCLGALSGTTTSWLAPPNPSRRDMRFTVDESGGFMVAVVNCGAAETTFPSVFSLSSVAYAIE
jgi:hypothetical protein